MTTHYASSLPLRLWHTYWNAISQCHSSAVVALLLSVRLSTQVLHEAVLDIAPTYITDDESQMRSSTRLQCGIARYIKSDRFYTVLENK